MATYFLTKDDQSVPVSWDGVTPWNPPAGWTLLTEAEFAKWSPTSPVAPVGPTVLRQDTDTVLRRLTAAERTALFSARETNPQIDYFVTRAITATVIRDDDADFPAARDALDAGGIIAAARWNDLLAP